MSYQNIKLLYFNAPSIVNKMTEFHCVAVENPDVVTLSEIWLNSRISDGEVLPSGYSLVSRKDRLDTLGGRGGGVAILTKSLLKVREIPTSLPSVCGKGIGPLQLFCVYLSPNASMNDHLDQNEFLSDPSCERVITGDFNHRKPIGNPMAGSSWLEVQFLRALNCGFLDQKVCFLTHQAGNILDLILTNSSPCIKSITSRGDITLFGI